MQRSRLAKFMADHGITVERLSSLSGKSVRHIYYLRRGETPHLRSALAIARGCRLATRKTVRLEDLFEIEDAKQRKEAS